MDDPEQFTRIDTNWIDICLYRSDEDDSGFSRAVFQSDEYESDTDIVVILGEADMLQPEMVELSSTPMPQRPKESHIFKMSGRESGKLRWHFMGRWTPLLSEANAVDVQSEGFSTAEQNSSISYDIAPSLDGQSSNRYAVEDGGGEQPGKRPRSASSAHSSDDCGENLVVHIHRGQPSALSTTTGYRTAPS